LPRLLGGLRARPPVSEHVDGQCPEMLLLDRRIDRLDFRHDRRNDLVARNSRRYDEAEIRWNHLAKIQQAIDQAAAEPGLAGGGNSLRGDERTASRQHGLYRRGRSGGRRLGQSGRPDRPSGKGDAKSQAQD